MGADDSGHAGVFNREAAMPTMRGRDFHDELATWLDGVKAEQGTLTHLRHISVPDDADQATLDAAMIALSVRKAKAVIPSTADEMQADIDTLLDRRMALGGA